MTIRRFQRRVRRDAENAEKGTIENDVLGVLCALCVSAPSALKAV